METETAEEANYQNDLKIILTCAQLVEHIDIPGHLRAISQCEAIGPILQPTLWMEKRDDMRSNEELLKAALPLQGWLKLHKAKAA